MATTAPDTAPIQRDIERTRGDMAATLYVLGDRLAPKKLLARVKENVRLKIRDKMEDLKGRLSPRRLVGRAAASLNSGSAPKRTDGKEPALSAPARPVGELPRGAARGSS